MKATKTVCAPIATLTLIGSLIGGANAAVISADGITSSVAPDGVNPATNLIDGIIGGVGTFNSPGWQDFRNPTLTFTFNSTQTITNIIIWQNGGNNFGDNQGWSALGLEFFDGSNNSLGTESFSGLPDANAGGDPWTSSSFNYTGVRSIVMTSIDSLGPEGSTDGNTDYSAREIQFNAVPEPSSALLLGLGSLGLALRRSRR